ncbi:CheY-like chemotaxis protein [Mucilaginibacter sp. SG538B]|uniref:response regulator n=1 Tax=Mucilaginibacter sp. SG538B TaxID=2587021 RepID=UPI00159E6526|nr:response regulator [Mucilaginibacter sp. SG538B]NVM66541.1 CheY-like chemotaxis protein [Mucilaginibacter sp. SG538B]
MLKNVLYIDDNQLDLYILTLLQRKYHLFKSCITTADAVGALRELKECATDKDHLPEIIFLDLYMPKFNGYQFLDKFEQIYPLFTKNIEVHILSSSMSPKDMQRCMLYPHVCAYHVKPITIEQLLSVIGSKP